jgi:hypothetical protein
MEVLLKKKKVNQNELRQISEHEMQYHIGARNLFHSNSFSLFNLLPSKIQFFTS